jgi:hypothetical protein
MFDDPQVKRPANVVRVLEPVLECAVTLHLHVDARERRSTCSWMLASN